MAFSNSRTQSIYGRRLGLQIMSTVQTGGSRGPVEFIVGPEDIRRENSTSNSTSVNLKPFGVQFLPSSSAGSSQVFTLDPPIPGVSVTIHNSTAATAYLKTGVLIKSTVGSTQAVVSFAAAGNTVKLTGVTTALWVSQTSTASGAAFAATT